VQPVGWVTDLPSGTIRRKRSPVRLAIAGVLLGAAAVGMATSILGLIETSGPSDEDTVAEGVVGALGGDGGTSATFTAGGADPFTVWIDTDGIFEENRRDNVVAATYCLAHLPGGGDDEADFQGNRQGTSVTIGDESTVGWFTAAEGQVEIACEQRPFGQRQTRDWLDDEHRFLVVRGKPSAPWSDIVVLTLSVGVGVLGAMLLARWHRGRIVTGA
jgi:hypothetical protein